MVEVFKTNVVDRRQADMLIQLVHYVDDRYRANFDLEDCDHILRVESTKGQVDARTIIALMQYFGSSAEVLPDMVESTEPDTMPHHSDMMWYRTLPGVGRG